MVRLALIASLLAACLPGLDPVEPPPIEQPPVPPPVEPETAVSVAVRDAGAPVPGVAVVFQTTDDLVIADVVTDATGTAVAAMPDGGNVTVIRIAVVDNTSLTTAYTVAGVKPGDVLELGGATTQATPIAATLKLRDATNYTVTTPCGRTSGTGPQLPIQLVGCGTETDFFVVDGAGNSFLARRPVGPAIDLSTELVRLRSSTTLSATNATGTITLEKRLLASSYSVFSTGELPGTSPVTTSVPDIGAALADQLVVAHLTQPGRQDIAVRGSYTTGTAAVDVGTSQIPFIEPATLVGRDVTWTQIGTGMPDFVVMTLTDGSLTRIVAAPITAPTVKLPSFAAARGVDVGADALVEHRTVRVTGGYDAIRGRVFASESLLEAAPASSTIAIASAQ